MSAHAGTSRRTGCQHRRAAPAPQPPPSFGAGDAELDADREKFSARSSACGADWSSEPDSWTSFCVSKTLCMCREKGFGNPDGRGRLVVGNWSQGPIGTPSPKRLQANQKKEFQVARSFRTLFHLALTHFASHPPSCFSLFGSGLSPILETVQGRRNRGVV